MIGHVLGGRYEIMERIGGGGMALVYKAHDILLNRKVAVKILRQQFVHDEEFIRRFRREAQSAASLSHPNVVSIYDVGRENETHYIVMEYIEGTNLNEKIKDMAPLQVEEAVHIASQICDALDHAHHNQIIHRDIKPHNILIGKNGRVKVTDFGIARAAKSTDITQTGSVIGSVHYFSPEHAQGVSQGEKSDIYSLGIVLYQMLTGKLPFLGESPISVALKHLQEEVEEPRKVNPLIPQSVENIILKAMRKKPQERYDSAGEMLKDLETCLLPAKRNEAKLAFSPDDADDEMQTRVMPAIRDKHASASDHDDARYEEWQGLNERKKKSMPWLKPLIWFVVVIALLLGMWFGVHYVLGKMRVPNTQVPDVRGVSIEQAKKQLAQAQLSPYPIDYKFSDNVPKDVVMEQENAGLTVKINSTIRLVVSKGVEMANMQDYRGMTWDSVQQQLQSNFSGDQIQPPRQVESDQPVGTIIDQSPAPNAEYDPKKVVFSFTVSKGKGTFDMPDLTGKTLEEAKAELLKNNLLLDDKIESEKSYLPKGTVVKQFPYEPGMQVEQGAKITLFLSSGYPDDAKEGIKNVVVDPYPDASKSTVKITVSDARGDMVWKTEDITKRMNYAVPVVVSKKTNAVITVYKNDTPEDIITVTYQDVAQMQQPITGADSGQTNTAANGTGASDQGTANAAGSGGSNP